jgi:uncharacterized membrane protein
LGGFADGIVLHQILQLHNMMSARIPPDNLLDVKVNMVWDGVFHAAVWIMTVTGLGLLFKAGGRADVRWSGQAFSGSLLLGWGLFNLIEGIIDHHLLGLHHVMEYAADKLPADLAFLAFGLALAVTGTVLIRRAALR